MVPPNELEKFIIDLVNTEHAKQGIPQTKQSQAKFLTDLADGIGNQRVALKVIFGLMNKYQLTNNGPVVFLSSK
jgi:hypothetical protein